MGHKDEDKRVELPPEVEALLAAEAFILAAAVVLASLFGTAWALGWLDDGPPKPDSPPIRAVSDALDEEPEHGLDILRRENAEMDW